LWTGVRRIPPYGGPTLYRAVHFRIRRARITLARGGLIGLAVALYSIALGWVQPGRAIIVGALVLATAILGAAIFVPKRTAGTTVTALADEMESFADRMHGFYRAFEMQSPGMIDTDEEMIRRMQQLLDAADEERREHERATDRDWRERWNRCQARYFEEHREAALRLFRQAEQHGVAYPDPGQPITSPSSEGVIRWPGMPAEIGMLSTVYRAYATRLRAKAG
jgi:hypothetical protein